MQVFAKRRCGVCRCRDDEAKPSEDFSAVPACVLPFRGDMQDAFERLLAARRPVRRRSASGDTRDAFERLWLCIDVAHVDLSREK